jgi:hypothetical protein
MHIEQLKKENSGCLNKIKKMQNVIYDDNSVDMMETKLIKEKYMKPVYLYILYPDYLKSALKNTMVKESADDDVKIRANSIIAESISKNIKCYEKNFNSIFSEIRGIELSPDEILYYHIGFLRKISKKNKLICVNTQWATDKRHFQNTLAELKNNSIALDLAKPFNKTIYKTSITEIKDILQEQFVKLSTPP